MARFRRGMTNAEIEQLRNEEELTICSVCRHRTYGRVWLANLVPTEKFACFSRVCFRDIRLNNRYIASPYFCRKCGGFDTCYCEEFG